MLSKAKTFFGSLGKRSKPGKLPDLIRDCTLDYEDTTMAPPSYHESQFVPPDLPEKPELSSATEIVEIDSTEIIASAADTPRPSIDPIKLSLANDLLLAELEDCMPTQSSMQWQPTPIAPHASHNFFFMAPPPTSQLLPSDPQPSHMGPRQAPLSVRSKNLSPSSSVRSTTSTTSNISTISTSSSLWSQPSMAWSNTDTNITSSSADFADWGSDGEFGNVVNYCPSAPLPVICELPADIPESHELPSGNFGGCASLFAFDGKLTAADIYPADFAVGDEALELPAAPMENTGRETLLHSDTKSYVASAWDTLQEHIISSHTKIMHIQTPLAKELLKLSPQVIVAQGLTSMRDILEGRCMTSPLHTLALLHVIYSFSFVIHGDDSTRRANLLFAQSLRWSEWFTCEGKAEFQEIAKAIWQPSNMTNAKLQQLMQNNKGKGRAKAPGDSTFEDLDPLVSTAQNFLDGRFPSSWSNSPI